LGFLTSQAGGIDFLHDKKWNEILTQAKKENKLIFLDAYASWCGPCKYMQSDVFTDMAVGYYYNKYFINIKMDMEEGEGVALAEQLGVRSYPTLLFINGDGQVVHKKIGSMEAGEFLQLGEDALNPKRQFYTSREKALTGDLSAEDFHQWIHDATEMEEDVDSVITAYLQKTKSPGMNKDMLAIMLDHASLNKEQIAFLFDNKDSCIRILGRTGDKFNASMQSRVAVYATNESLSEDKFDFDKFQQIAKSYFPTEAALMTKKVKIRYYNYTEEYAKSLDELASCITSPTLNLKVGDLSDLITQNIKTITEQKRLDEFIQKVSLYKLSPAESSSKAYLKNLPLFVLYYCKDDKVNMKTYSDKIMKDTNAPDQIKSKVQEFLEEARGK
jgi:thiol-disulfide isomerase/thioredoxin